MVPTTTCEDLVERGIKEYCNDDNVARGHARFDYSLVDSQGSELSDHIDGNPWNLAEHLHVHGLYPSKINYTSNYLCTYCHAAN